MGLRRVTHVAVRSLMTEKPTYEVRRVTRVA
jgi:hypothetical protein